VFRTIGQVVLPLAVLALIAVGQWGGEVHAERDLAPAMGLDSAESIGTAQDETEQPTKKNKKQSAAEETPASDETAAGEVAHEAEFLPNAFPPVIPDTEWHQEAWLRDDCLRCHETGVGQSPQIVHEGMPQILLKAKCRSCHVFIEGTPAPPQEETVSQFDANAFPPVIPDTDWHQDAWLRDDCLRCHETGVGQAPQIVHEGMAQILLKAKCRSCHVFIEGTPAPPVEEQDSQFNANAFPPMIPASGSHRTAWIKDDCLLCHEEGNSGAPVIVHEGMPDVLLQAKCRSCHVQIRSDEASRSW
jgi:ferredoxin